MNPKHLLLCALAIATIGTAAPDLPGPDGPNAKQHAMIKRGYGMFIHFGINTFNELEWSKGDLPASSYNPTHLDCEQWVQTAKEAGFRYIVLITKHHDGFCLWDSKVTSYDVAASPVKTDVVAEVAKACKKHGIQLGLYYSLWDRHEPCYGDEAKYIGFMKSQLTELMTNYGPICELWLDGGWMKKKNQWDIPGLYDLVNRLQPGCTMSTNFSIEIPGKPESNQPPDRQQTGDPIRFWPTDFRLLDPLTARGDDPKFFTTPDGKRAYLPYEHTICISEYWNWFQKKDIRPVRKLDELEELFYWCTANDNLLVINVPPDTSGRIRPHERQRILQLADRLGIRGGTTPLPGAPVNQALGAKAEATSTYDADHGAAFAFDADLGSRWAAKDNTPELTFAPAAAKEFTFDRIAIHEYRDSKDKGDGFSALRESRIQEYTLELFRAGEWQPIHYGFRIDAVEVIRFPEILHGEKLRLRVIKANAPPSIHHIAVGVAASAKPR